MSFSKEAFVSPSSGEVWDLQRKGSIDQARHNQKIKEAIKDNLESIISEEAIITSDGNKVVKVPIRGLDLPEFRYDYRKKPHIGEGDGSSNIGDVIGHDPGSSTAPGRGKRAGELPGIDYYDAEITIDELTALIFEDLGLPNLKKKQHHEIQTTTYRYDDIRKKGILSNLEKRKTILENIKRNAILGKGPRFQNIADDDLRFKTFRPHITRESNAAVIAMRDVSGSMGEFEKYITRSFYFWMVRFLRTKYNNVNITFITHHTEAKEVDEKFFFQAGESGGTRVSPAYKLTLDIIKERYHPDKWNIYPFHFSDGDNWGDSDNKLCLELIRKMLKVCNMVGYGEIREYNYDSQSTLLNNFQDLKNEPNFISAIIKDKKDVYPALKTFFKKDHIDETDMVRV